MTRPTDSAIARAFWEIRPDLGRFARSYRDQVIERAHLIDAESPAGTECKICGGGNVYCAACMSKSAPEVTVNSERVQIPAESTHVRCPKCAASLPAGKTCGGTHCRLKETK